MGSQPPLEIPGSSIRPPDNEKDEHWCPHCRNYFRRHKTKVDPNTGETYLACPHCGERLTP